MKKLLPILAALLTSCGHKPPLEVKKVEPEAPVASKRFSVSLETFNDGGFGGGILRLYTVYDSVTSNEVIVAESLERNLEVVSRREIR